MIFTKEDVSTSDEQVEKFTREYNNHYRACIGSFIYLLSTRVDLWFAVHKIENISVNPGYVDDCVYWYTNEDIGKWFVDTLGKIFHVNFLGFAHWFMPIIISQLKDHSISVDQARYATSIVAKYLETDTVKVSNKFYKTTLSSDMIFTKEDVSTSDEKI